MRRNILFLLGLIAALAVGVVLVASVLQPTREDIPVFGLLLAVPVVVATVAAVLARQRAWWRQFRSVVVALFITYAIAAGLILLTVFVTARLMFISPHDAALALVIVGFATCVTLVFGYFVAQSLSDGIADIMRAARAVQRGDLAARADDQGSDELAALARSFNEMTAELRRVREREAELDRLKRDLIAWVSHDLRTPLTSIRARVEALADGVVDDPADVARYLAAIRGDTQALNRLIDDLFELATIDAGGLQLKPTPVELSDMVSDTVERMSVIAARRGVRLNGSVASGVDPVTLSPQHIQRVLNNLVGNALAHTPAGGSVEVRVSRDAAPLHGAAGVRVEVTDTGEGIAPQDLPRVFERFYRGERSRARNGLDEGNPTGMGLGLAIAQALIQAHGGQIGLTSEPGQGTCVWFTLPQGK